MDSRDVTVTVTVNIGGTPHTKTASALTDADPYHVAEGLLAGIHNDTDQWLRDERRARRGGI
jgi:nanoRNase/pAp phosphatase (c-di-AMP/oligoRNAs hydrolase)